MANRYDITVRSFSDSEGVTAINVQRLDNLTAEGISVIIQQMLANCVAEYRAGNCPDPNATEESIFDDFDELMQTLFKLEQSHNEQSMTFKILDTFITVQVIFAEEST